MTQSAGNDSHDGCTGEDIIWYIEQVRVDLENPDRNTNTAHGDTIENIKTILGSIDHADNLSGDRADNILLGDAHTTSAIVRGSHIEAVPTPRLYEVTETDYAAQMGDRLFGRGGDNILFGGAGRD